MRNLKKHLSVLLVLAMVFTMMAPVFAASSYNYEEEARILYALGLYKGVSDKNFVPDLGSALTREQDTILLLRLFGQEEEALAMSEADVTEVLSRFADADQISPWARNQVAYAASIGVIKGIESENGLIFNPQGALKGNDCASLLLQQLGVKDFEYFGALEKLASLGAISVAQMISFDKAQMIRDDVVGMSYGALTAVAANGKTVIANLIEKGLADRAIAEKYGLVEAIAPVVEPTEPAVEPTEPAVEPVVGEAKVEFIPEPSQSVAQNQTLCEVGRVKITAASEKVAVTGLKVQRTGLSADSDVSSVTVWNGTEKVNSIGKFSNGIANIAFTKDVTVNAGESLELAIKMNLNGDNARVGAQVGISLLEVKANATLLGTFPMKGNVFTIAPADLGKLEIKHSGDSPTANVNAGDKDIRLAKFEIDIKDEAQVLKQLTLTQDGTIADSDLANLKLVDDDDKVLATGELKNGEVTFVFEKEYASGTTARLTLRGDVLGGTGRTIFFTVNNKNDLQSVGKTYGTTIVAQKEIEFENEEDIKVFTLKVERGTLVLAKANISPEAATIAQTVDDQKFTTVKIEAIGEELQLETVKVAIKGETDKVKEVKLVKDGVVIASQEIKNNLTEDEDYNVIELSLSEVVTVDPAKPIIIDILADVKGAAENDEFVFGIKGIEYSGLTSGKENLKNVDLTIGNPMTVGDIKVTFEQVAQVNGYVFKNQSEEKLAEFEVYHNLGETVKLSSVVVCVTDTEGDAVSNADVANTFKNVKLVSEDGKVVSETLVKPESNPLRLSMKEGVVIDPGKTIKLGLVSDIKNDANEGSEYEFIILDKDAGSKAITKTTGVDVDIEPTIDSRAVTVSEAANVDNVDMSYSVNGDLNDENVLREDSNKKLAQWTLSNNNKEAIRINKVYLTAKYGQTTEDLAGKDLKPAYVTNYVLQDEKGRTLATFSSLPSGKAKEITLTTPLVIPAEEDGIAGENELIVRANIAKGAQYGGTISIALGRETLNNDVASYDYFEATGVVSGQKVDVKDIGTKITTITAMDGDTPVAAGKIVTVADGEDIQEYIVGTRIEERATTEDVASVTEISSEGDRTVMLEPETSQEPTPVTLIKTVKIEKNGLLQAGEHGDALVRTVAVSVVKPVKVTLSQPEEGKLGQQVAEFKLSNTGKTAVSMEKVTMRLTDNTNHEFVADKELRLLDENGKLLVVATKQENGDLEFNFEPNRLKISEGASKTFKVCLAADDKLTAGETVELSIVKEGTCYDTVTNLGYQISIDMDAKDDGIFFAGGVTAKHV